MNKILNNLKVNIFADGANKDEILELNKLPFIKGFTTNPTLMKKAGIKDYVSFAKDILSSIKDKPISFEVFADDFKQMEKQAQEINSWSKNVYIKIPITNSKGESSINLIKKLSSKGLKLNITAVFTLQQVLNATLALNDFQPSIISVFAGRIADTGTDPVPLMKAALQILKIKNNIKLLWASPREVYNIIQANEIGCDIITVTKGILDKLELLGKNHEELSLDTVKMFYNDALKCNYNI